MHLPTSFRSSVLLILAFTLIAGTAWSATYWVSPSGVAGRTGADSLSNSTTLAWVNTNANSGDVIRFKSGTYTDPVYPRRANVTTARIRYYGFPQDPGAVSVSYIQFGTNTQHEGDYITVRWVTARSGDLATKGTPVVSPPGGDPAFGDSAVACVFLAGGIDAYLAQSLVVDSCKFTYVDNGTLTTSNPINIQGTGAGVDGSGNPTPWQIAAKNNVIMHCNFNLTFNGSGSVQAIVAHGGTAYNTVSDNVINITNNRTQGYWFLNEQYESHYLSILRNTVNIVFNVFPDGTHGLFTQRDSSNYAHYIGNTIRISGVGYGDGILSNSGTWSGTTGHNLFDHNTIITSLPGQLYTGLLYWQNGVRSDTLQYNTIISAGNLPCVSINSQTSSDNTIDGLIMRHNTFVSGSPTVVDFNVNNPIGAASRFTSNIYYSLAANSASHELVKIRSGIRLDSAGTFFARGGDRTKAIAYAGVTGAPGSGGNFGNSSESVWGSPRFADSTIASFNPTLTASSFAAGPNYRDGFTGAIPFDGGSGDVTPPAVVNDLRLSQPGVSSLLVEWTAPGNDGNVGTASNYDLRYSTSAIDATNFAFATPVLPQPVPASAGSAQSYVALNLSAGTMYYFAIRARDAAGNWSLPGFSSPMATAADTISPAAIVDLRAQ